MPILVPWEGLTQNILGHGKHVRNRVAGHPEGPTYLMEMHEIRSGVKEQMCLINNFDCSSPFLGHALLWAKLCVPLSFIY